MSETDELSASRLWEEARAMPATLAATVSAADGFDELAALLAGAGRIVASGNGASYYAAHALWLAAVGSGAPRAAAELPELEAVPAGLLAAGRFGWREGDVLLAFSSSGELRDAIEALRAGAPATYGAVTAAPGSTIGSGARARALVSIESQEAVTHTQAFAGSVLAGLAVWARVTGDDALARATRDAPEAVAASLEEAERWVADAARPLGSPVAAVTFGTGPAWAAALEASLLLKEVARIPAEGMETREGATSGMYALGPGHLVLSLPAGSVLDPLLAEAEATCAETGAAVVRAPGGTGADARLAALTTFPAALALSIVLGRRAGHDVDRPGWADAYYATARVPGTEVA